MRDEFERAVHRDLVDLHKALSMVGHSFIPVALDLGPIRDEGLRDELAESVMHAHGHLDECTRFVDDAMDALLAALMGGGE